jgi:hypothetical protein
MSMIEIEVMLIESAFVAVKAFASCTCTLKANDPVEVGVPASAPVEPSREMPGGRFPVTTDHE